MANRSKGPVPCSSSRHTSQVSAVSCGGVDIDVCRRHGRRHCYPTVSAAAHQCVLPRDLSYSAYRNCIRMYSITVRRYILQHKPAVVSRSSAALFNEDTNTWLKVKWLYCKCSADRPTISLIHSQQRQLLLSDTWRMTMK